MDWRVWFWGRQLSWTTYCCLRYRYWHRWHKLHLKNQFYNCSSQLDFGVFFSGLNVLSAFYLEHRIPPIFANISWKGCAIILYNPCYTCTYKLSVYKNMVELRKELLFLNGTCVIGRSLLVCDKNWNLRGVQKYSRYFWLSIKVPNIVISKNARLLWNFDSNFVNFSYT